MYVFVFLFQNRFTGLEMRKYIQSSTEYTNVHRNISQEVTTTGLRELEPRLRRFGPAEEYISSNSKINWIWTKLHCARNQFWNDVNIFIPVWKSDRTSSKYWTERAQSRSWILLFLFSSPLCLFLFQLIFLVNTPKLDMVWILWRVPSSRRFGNSSRVFFNPTD